jgi:hypothetical protein
MFQLHLRSAEKARCDLGVILDVHSEDRTVVGSLGFAHRRSQQDKKSRRPDSPRICHVRSPPGVEAGTNGEKPQSVKPDKLHPFLINSAM